MAEPDNIACSLQNKQLDPLENYPVGTNYSTTRVRIVNESGDPIYVDSSLITSGVITEVSINSTTWTALPVTPLSGRVQINIQNISTKEIALNWSQPAGYVGMRLQPDDERQYDLDDTVVIYAKSKNGSGIIINVEEIKIT